MNRTVRILHFALLGLILLAVPGQMNALAGSRCSRAVSSTEMALFQKARTAFENGRTEECAQILQAYVTTGKAPHPYACQLYGNALLRTDRPGEAETAFRKALSDLPGDYATLRNLGVAQSRQEKWGPAAESFLLAADAAEDKAKKPQKQAFGLRYLAATCLFRVQDYKRALEVLTPLLHVKKPRIKWIRLAGGSYLRLGNYPEAERIFERLVNRKPDHKPFWRVLAHIRMKRENYQGAASALEISAGLEYPGSGELRQLAALYHTLGAPLLATDRLKTIRSDASPEDHDIIARTLAGAGRDEEALAHARMAIQADPTGKMYILAGTLLHRLGRYSEAAQAFSQAPHYGSDPGHARFMQAMSLWEADLWSEAEQVLATVPRKGRYGRQAEQMLQFIAAFDEAKKEAEDSKKTALKTTCRKAEALQGS